MRQTIWSHSLGLLALALLSTSISANASTSVASSTKPTTTLAVTANEANINNSASHEVEKRRKSLVKEVVVANDEIQRAIAYLEKKDAKKAFKSLEKADGQLNVVMAREPNLKLAALDVRANIIDFESTPDAIHKMVKEAKSSLEHGDVQAARNILTPMVSELHIDIDYLPLEIYPAAIKQASEQIQHSKYKTAEATLAGALSSIVTNEEVIALPPLKAEGDMLKAEMLLDKDKVKNKAAVIALLNKADDRLANADALGYGKYNDIHNEIASIKSKVEGGEAKHGLFDRAKNLFHKISPAKQG